VRRLQDPLNERFFQKELDITIGGTMKVIAIDPGQSGAFVGLDSGAMSCELMPLQENKDVDFDRVQKILSAYAKHHVFLERAHPGAMGVSGAFNYGRAFATLELAIKLSGLAVTYVEPAKWTKLMHEGISSDLKPKAKSLIAVRRLFPELIDKIPKTPRSGKLHDGVVDALLIAGYGARLLGKREVVSIDDF
jgi:hypothetical protein